MPRSRSAGGLEQRLGCRLAVAGIGGQVALALLEQLQLGRDVGGLVGDGDPVGPLVPHRREITTARRLLRFASGAVGVSAEPGFRLCGLRAVGLVVRERRVGPGLRPLLRLLCDASSAQTGSWLSGSVSRNRPSARVIWMSPPSGSAQPGGSLPGHHGPGHLRVVSRARRAAPPAFAKRFAIVLPAVQDPRQQHEHRQDLGPEALEEGRGCPVERLADGAPCTV